MLKVSEYYGNKRTDLTELNKWPSESGALRLVSTDLVLLTEESCLLQGLAL